jgi:hypothetical protein
VYKIQVFIEGLIAITALESINIVIYGSKHLKYHKTNPAKIKDLLNKKETLFDVFVDDYEKKSFKLGSGKQQLTCGDFALVHFSNVARVEATFPKGMHMTVTKALFE